MKTKLLRLASIGGAVGAIAGMASPAFATTLLNTTDQQAVITGQVTALSTTGGAILAAVVVVIAALILFRFGVKWAKRSVK